MAEFLLTRKFFFHLKLKDSTKIYQFAKFQLDRIKIDQVIEHVHKMKPLNGILLPTQLWTGITSEAITKQQCNFAHF